MTNEAEKLETLTKLRFGDRVAENEADKLSQYFVETDQWRRVYTGEIDVVYGPKGSGKSALYTLLCSKESELFDNGILIAAAEAIRGSTVFRDLTADPPPTEQAFIALWKLYCLALIGSTIREYQLSSKEAKDLVGTLEQVGLLTGARNDLYSLFRSVKNYLFQWMGRDPKAVEWELSIDPSTGLPTSVKRRTEFDAEEGDKKLTHLPIEELLRIADTALRKEKLKLWILFDRLDIAFTDSPKLERNALRALFRTYRDLQALDQVSLKLFVRDDIWRRISKGGFAEASHITKTIYITWDTRSLLNLVIKRLIWNGRFVEHLGVGAKSLLEDYDAQTKLIYQIIPDQIDTGKNPDTFDWMVNRTSDAFGKPAPRELIHLLDCAREAEIRRIERGDADLPDLQLFERAVFKDALGQVSKVRLEQTLLAENPDFVPWIKRLEGEKSEQTAESLATLWGVSSEQAAELINELLEAGFFEARGDAPEQSFWIPFLYRPALGLVQGKAH